MTFSTQNIPCTPILRAWRSEICRRFIWKVAFHFICQQYLRGDGHTSMLHFKIYANHANATQNRKLWSNMNIAFQGLRKLSLFLTMSNVKITSNCITLQGKYGLRASRPHACVCSESCFTHKPLSSHGDLWIPSLWNWTTASPRRFWLITSNSRKGLLAFFIYALPKTMFGLPSMQNTYRQFNLAGHIVFLWYCFF